VTATRSPEHGAADLQAFAASLAHELSNAVNGVYLNAQLVEALAARAAPDAPAPMAEVLAQCERCVRIVYSLRRYAMAPAPTRPRRSSVAAMLRAVARSADDMTMAGPVSVQVRRTPPGAAMSCDRKATAHILAELVRNATQAGARSIVLTADVQSTGIVIRVRDDGCGIEPAIAARMFEPFVSGWREHGNLGLGLAQSRELALRQSGRLALESSAPGQTVMALILPPAGAAATPVD
jgi:signal transduction histidine kinase